MASTLQRFQGPRHTQFPVPFRCHGGVRLSPFRFTSVHFGVMSCRRRKSSLRRGSYEGFRRILNGGPNGIRTRVSALRGPCPGPLDDGAGQVLRKQRRTRQQLTRNLLAGGGGFEPPLRGPEPRVLPLDDPPPTHPTLPHPQTTQRMAVLSARLGRRRGTLVVGIWIFVPVRGLRAV